MYLGIWTVQSLKALGHPPGAAIGWKILSGG